MAIIRHGLCPVILSNKLIFKAAPNIIFFKTNFSCEGRIRIKNNQTFLKFGAQICTHVNIGLLC